MEASAAKNSMRGMQRGLTRTRGVANSAAGSGVVDRVCTIDVSGVWSAEDSGVVPTSEIVRPGGISDGCASESDEKDFK